MVEEADRLTLPVAGVALSHVPLGGVVATAADQFNELAQGPLALIVTACVWGFDWPTTPSKVRSRGAAAIVHTGDDTVKVTGIDCGLPAAAFPELSVPVMVIVPV